MVTRFSRPANIADTAVAVNAERRNMQRFTFHLFDSECELGTAKELVLRGQPKEPLIAERIIIRAECEEFYEIEDIILNGHRVHELSRTQDHKSVVMQMLQGHVSDPFVINKHAPYPYMWMQDGKLGMRIGPDAAVTQVTMSYTGKIPKGFHKGHRFRAGVLLLGPAAG